jgi:hypothetical protein
VAVWHNACHAIVRASISIVLFVAVASKAVAFRTHGGAPSSPFQDLLAILELLTEWLIAAWLLSGIAQDWSRRAAMLLLLVFVVVTTWRLVRGDPDCHCFGDLRVPPLLTLSFDLLALVALYGLGHTTPHERLAAARSGKVKTPALLHRISLVAAISVVLPASVFLAERRLLGSQATFVAVVPPNPQSWRGEQFPLLEFVSESDRADLTAGNRTVILFRHDCETCRQYLARRADASGVNGDASGATRLIDVVSATASDGFSPPYPEIHLRRPVVCLAALPLEVVLKDGVVQAIRWPE